MRVMVIGGGGREHAMCWALNQDPDVDHVFCLPGNPGTQTLKNVTNVVHAFSTHLEAAIWAKQNSIDLCLVGPEKPLQTGIVDCFKKNKIAIFGPSQHAAQLESSKFFAKQIMQEASIPTAQFNLAHTYQQAEQLIHNQLEFPTVAKYDGLAAGKGVIICQNKQEALHFCHQVFNEHLFSKQPAPIIFEEHLSGEEMSFFALCNKKKYCFFGDAQDHKRLLEEDKGPNTGGMGAYTPTHLLTPELRLQIEQTILQPLLKCMQNKNMPFTGFLYMGLMLTTEGPKVIEFNVRLGDPEAQCILRRLKTPFGKLCLNMLQLKKESAAPQLKWKNKKSFVVTLASKGYPKNPEINIPLHISKDIKKEVLVFHAGTQMHKDQLMSSGGRVLSVSTLGDNFQEAADVAYQCLKKDLQLDGGSYRKDIGKSVLKRTQT